MKLPAGVESCGARVSPWREVPQLKCPGLGCLVSLVMRASYVFRRFLRTLVRTPSGPVLGSVIRGDDKLVGW
jgi:hypothetical protein